MKLFKYRLFNTETQSYLPGVYYVIEELAETLDRYKTPYSNLEVHQIEVGKVDLVIENED